MSFLCTLVARSADHVRVSKIGIETRGAKLHASESDLNSPDSSALAVPNAAVSEMRGKSVARAAPMSALAALSWLSAWRTSGRRRSTSDGMPGATSPGGITPARLAGSSSSGTGEPTSRLSAFRSSAAFWV